MIVTFTTDFGLKDHFVGVMKGSLLKIAPQVQIVDLCHNIPPYDIKKAYLLLQASVNFFPKNTVHVVVVDPTVGPNHRRILYLHAYESHFLAPDNGVLSFIPPKEIKKIYEVCNKKLFNSNISHTFHGRDIFAPVAGHISQGISTQELGPKIDVQEICTLSIPAPNIQKRKILGEVIYIDHFGNAITNIAKKMLPENPKQISVKDLKLHLISSSYANVEAKKYVALINSLGLLEIAQNQGNAVASLQIGEKTSICVNW